MQPSIKKREQNTKALDLFFLLFHLSQITIKSKFIPLFLDALREIWPEHGFTYQLVKPDDEEDCLALNASGSSYGYIVIENRAELGNEDHALLHNAVAMLSIFLKKNEQDTLLAEKKNRLQEKVKRKQSIINKSEISYRSIFENIHDVFYETSIDGTILELSPSVSIISKGQYTRADLIGRTFVDLYENPEERRFFLSAIKEKGFINDFEIRLKNRDFSSIPCAITAKIVSDMSGRPSKIVGILHDITERKQNEEKLKEKEVQFRKLSVNIPGVFFQCTKSPDGTYSFPIASEGIKDVFGCSPEDVRETCAPIQRVILPEESQRVMSDFEYSAKHLTALSCEFRVQIPGKAVKWIYCKAKPEKIADGTISWYGFYSDISKRKEAEDALLRSRQELQEALDVSNRSRKTLLSVLEDQRKAENEVKKFNEVLEQRVKERTSQLEASNKELEAFSYSVSHDLRAPLRHINGFAGLLAKKYSDQLSEDGLNYLDTITDAATKMGALIDDLLSFSRAGRTELKKTSVNMNQVIEDALTEINVSGMNRTVDWDISSLPDVHGDYNLLLQVWVNLLDNALKYTSTREKAIISIGYKNGKNEFIFYIQDNGVGFDMKYAPKLFGVFQRLHSSAEFDGTGIGLANVRRIILRHGGRTWTEAELDKGATFYFSMPKQPA